MQIGTGDIDNFDSDVNHLIANYLMGCDIELSIRDDELIVSLVDFNSDRLYSRDNVLTEGKIKLSELSLAAEKR